MQHRFETTVCTLKAIPWFLWDENKIFRGDEAQFSAHKLQIYQILCILLTTPCKQGYPYDELVKKGSQMRKGSFKICLFILNSLWMIKSEMINGLKNWFSKLFPTLWLPTVDKSNLIGTDYMLIASCLTTLVCFEIATNKTRIQIAQCGGIHKEWHMALLKICIISF